MKSDRSGTPAEQQRWHAGWMTPTQRRERPEMGRCRDCLAFEPPHDGKGEFCAMHGFATRPGAVCRGFRVRKVA